VSGCQCVKVSKCQSHGSNKKVVAIIAEFRWKRVEEIKDMGEGAEFSNRNLRGDEEISPRRTSFSALMNIIEGQAGKIRKGFLNFLNFENFG
jgi:hypothetical protein